MNKQDQVRADVTARLVESIEKGVKPWRQPWLSAGAPKNVVSGRGYRGVNVWHLAWHMMVNNFTVPVYATFNQWRSLGFTVKPRPSVCPGNIYGIPIVFYSIVKKKTPKDAPADDANPKHFPILRSWTVFNVDQVQGDRLDKIREKFTVKPVAPVDAHPDAEKVISSSGASITYGGDRAFYRPSDDTVTLPERQHFRSQVSFYGTAFHELGHWTGAAARLNRCPKFARFGSEAYALEELVAEMAGVFTLSAVGLPVDTELENHASYLDNWLRVLRSDNRVIFTASSAAQAASDYLLQKAGLMQEGQSEPTE